MENPYQAPQSVYQQAPVMASSGQMNPGIIQALRGSKGWVRFMAVLGFIVTALMIFGGIAIMALSSSRFMGDVAIGVGLVYIVMGGVNLFVAIKLNQYASRIGDF